MTAFSSGERLMQSEALINAFFKKFGRNKIYNKAIKYFANILSIQPYQQTQTLVTRQVDIKASKDFENNNQNH